MKSLILAAVLLSTTLLASAQTVGVDFNSNADAPNHDVNDPGTGISPTFTDKGVLGEKFTGINTGGKGLAISDGVTVDVTLPDGDPSCRDQWTDPCNDLFRDYIQSEPNKKLTVTIHGLKAKTAYKLVVYGGSSRAGTDVTSFAGAITGTLSGTNADGTKVSRNSFVEGQNYLKTTATADDSGSITFTVSSPTGGWGILNGFGLAPDTAPKP